MSDDGARLRRAARLGHRPPGAGQPPAMPSPSAAAAPVQAFGGGFGRNVRRFGAWVGRGFRWLAGLPGRAIGAVAHRMRRGRAAEPQDQGMELEPMLPAADSEAGEARPVASGHGSDLGEVAGPMLVPAGRGESRDEEQPSSPAPLPQPLPNPIAPPIAAASARALVERPPPPEKPSPWKVKTAKPREKIAPDPKENLESEEAADLGEVATRLSREKAGHGRGPHARKIVNRPGRQVEKQRERDAARSHAMLQEQVENRLKKMKAKADRGKKRKKKDKDE